jgi:hypothetical protein
MLKRFRGVAIAAAVALCASAGIAYAAGLWSTLPIVGGSSYCASYVTGTGNLSGATGQGQGTIGQICGQTVPAGPATFTGTEMVPMDLLAPGTQSQGPTTTALANISQLGQGALDDVTASGAALTIPNGTMFYVLDTGTSATTTVTMPASAIEGQMVEIICTGAGGATSLTVSANTGQALKAAPAAGACAAGTVYKFRFVAVAPFASAPIAANTWLRVQ